MRKSIWLGIALMVIFCAIIGYQFTENSIQNRAKDVALNSDACLFYTSSSKYGDKTEIYCSHKNSLSVINGSIFITKGTPIITDETLKGLDDVVVFESFKIQDRVSVSIKLYQYGHKFQLDNLSLSDIPGYSIAIKRAVIGELYR